MNQMAENEEPTYAAETVERLIDQLGDAVGGAGSFTIISGGSSAQRRLVVDQALLEAEGMGCLVSRCSGARSGNGREPLGGALYDLLTITAGGHAEISLPDLVVSAQEGRSYRAEMACLDMLRSLSRDNTVMLVLEDIESTGLDTITVLRFLARNIGGLNVLMVATHRSPEDDLILLGELDDIKHSALVHELHVHGTADGEEDVSPILHESAVQRIEEASGNLPHPSVGRITGLIDRSRSALGSGDVAVSIDNARSALEGSRSIGHNGLMIDAYLSLGHALGHEGMEKEALEAFDQAIGLSATVGEAMPQYLAHVAKSELLLFSVGEPDTAFAEALSAAELWPHSPTTPAGSSP